MAQVNWSKYLLKLQIGHQELVLRGNMLFLRIKWLLMCPSLAQACRTLPAGTMLLGQIPYRRYLEITPGSQFYSGVVWEQVKWSNLDPPQVTVLRGPPAEMIYNPLWNSVSGERDGFGAVNIRVPQNLFLILEKHYLWGSFVGEYFNFSKWRIYGNKLTIVDRLFTCRLI